MPAPQALLAIDALGKDYTATVLDGVALTLNAGEVLPLTGEHGAGKSTLAKILCGLTLPTRGHMRQAGQGHAPACARGPPGCAALRSTAPRERSWQGSDCASWTGPRGWPAWGWASSRC